MQAFSKLETKLTLDMTPMIDIVFQLLVFFVMTLQIALAEGDLQIALPVVGPAASQDRLAYIPPLQLNLRSTTEGQLAEIQLAGKSYGQPEGPQDQKCWQALQGDLANLLSSTAEREGAELEIRADAALGYQYSIDAITAVSAHRDATGRWTKLVQKVKLAPQPSR